MYSMTKFARGSLFICVLLVTASSATVSAHQHLAYTNNDDASRTGGVGSIRGGGGGGGCEGLASSRQRRRRDSINWLLIHSSNDLPKGDAARRRGPDQVAHITEIDIVETISNDINVNWDKEEDDGGNVTTTTNATTAAASTAGISKNATMDATASAQAIGELGD